jgi:hypothetical protein
MRSTVVRLGVAAAVSFAASLAFAAQNPRSAGAGVPTQSSAQAPQRRDVINVVGCVEREADYRKRINNGKGGALGSGAGAANEFVVTFAKIVPGTGVHDQKTHAPVGTTGLEEVYAVTGKLEDELKREVGRQVEITGYIEVDESHGTTKVKDLPRMNADHWSRVADYCPRPSKN